MPTAAVRTRIDYVCSDSEDKVTKRCLAKGYFQDWTKVVEIDLGGSLRSQ